MKNVLSIEGKKHNEVNYSSIYLCQIGGYQCKSSYSFGPAVRNHYLIHFVTKGKGVFYFQGEKEVVKANEMFMIVPNEVTFYEADKEDPWEYHWIGISGLAAKEMMNMIGLKDTVRIRQYREGDDGKIIDYIKELLMRKVENESDRFYEIAKIYEIFSNLRYYFEQSEDYMSKHAINGYLHSAIDYFQKNYAMPITINDLSHFIGLDRTQIYRLFMKNYGISPKEYLIMLRINRAKNLLRTTDLPIKSIAYSVGYDNQYMFSKIFKKRMGVAPKFYRENSNSKAPLH